MDSDLRQNDTWDPAVRCNTPLKNTVAVMTFSPQLSFGEPSFSAGRKEALESAGVEMFMLNHPPPFVRGDKRRN
jgi:hypothetical protein